MTSKKLILGDMGEFRLLREHILPQLSKLARSSVLGDDCGWLNLEKDKVLLASTDTLVEDFHYKRKWMSFKNLGAKAVRVAVSDIAAMGGAESLGVLVTLGLNRETSLRRLKDFLDGLKEGLQRSRASLLGGDVVEAQGKEFVSISVFGIAEKSKLLLRSQAKVGETLWTTGPLGLASAGLEVLQKRKQRDFPFLSMCHLMPPLRLKEGKILSQKNLSRCAIDLSDSLACSLLWISKGSHVGLEVDLRKLIIFDELELWQRASKRALEDYLVYGGEDYELLFTSSAESKEICRFLGTALAIGKVVNRSQGVSFLDCSGEKQKITEEHLGYQAFKSGV